ncbi:hypothetical protein VPH35_102058 [Triticum aestivum]
MVGCLSTSWWHYGRPFSSYILVAWTTSPPTPLRTNQLWPRHLLTLGVQTVGVCYVLYKHMTHEPAMVVAASLMFMVGFFKYGERTWALKRDTLENIRSSIKTQPDRTVPEGSIQNVPDEEDVLPEGSIQSIERVPDEEELMLFAHHVLPTCMAALTDYSEDSGKVSALLLRYTPPKHKDWKAEHIGKIVEMELSLMYDILYTKATMIHHWYGYFLRVISILATMVALLLFHFLGKKVRHAKIDVIITYILFGGALILDMVSLVKAAMSTWTCDLLENVGGWGKTLCKRIQSSRRRMKAASSAGWSGSVGQYNLFDACSRDMTKPSIRVLQMIKLDDWWMKYQYKRTLVIPAGVKELLFQEIWSAIRYSDPATPFVLPSDLELQDMISVWHITTNLFLPYAEANGGDATYVGAIKVLSDYMMFLAVARHDMLPALKLRSNCEKTSNDLQKIWSGETATNREAGFGSLLPHLLRNGALSSYRSLSYGTGFAKELQLVMNKGKRDSVMADSDMERLFRYTIPMICEDKNIGPDGVILPDGKLLKLILDQWVSMLVAASIRCSRESHAKQLSHGGELITIVWILTEHFRRPARL